MSAWDYVLLPFVLAFAYAFNLLFFGWSGLLAAAIAWWLSRWLARAARVAIRGAAIAVAFAPALYGHEVLVPASFAVFFPPERGRIYWVAVATILIVWVIASAIILRVERSRNAPRRSS